MMHLSRDHARLLAHVLITATVVIVLALMEFGIVPEMKSMGFYCDDPGIAHKFAGDTISARLLLSVTLLMPLIVICSTEWLCEGYNKRSSIESCSWLRQAFYWYRDYFSGFLVVFFLTNVGKLLVGEPRPHFLDTCRPHQARNCSSGYVSSYTCTNLKESEWKIRDASKSFPSGHASLSIYCAVFTTVFLQRRLRESISRLVITWLQTLCLTWALICSLTRITDHRHHWWDVLAGSLLGTFTALYTVQVLCVNFGVERSAVSGTSLSQPETNGHILFNGNGADRSASVRRLLGSTDPGCQITATT